MADRLAVLILGEPRRGTIAFDRWSSRMWFLARDARGQLEHGNKDMVERLYKLIQELRDVADRNAVKSTNAVLRREICRCVGPVNPCQPLDIAALPHDLITDIFNRLASVDRLAFTLATGQEWGQVTHDPTPNRTKAFIAAVVLKLLNLFPMAVAQRRMRDRPYLLPSQAARVRQLSRLSVPAIRFLAASLVSAVAGRSQACGEAFSVVDRMVSHGIYDPDYQVLSDLHLDVDDWSEPQSHVWAMPTAVFMQLLMPVQGLDLDDLAARVA